MTTSVDYIYCQRSFAQNAWLVYVTETPFYVSSSKIATLLLTTFGAYALLGEHERFLEEGREQNIRANKLIIHPNASLANLGDDLALIRLEHGVKFSPFVRTVCLPRPTDVFYVRPGKSCVIAGWGSSRRVSGSIPQTTTW